MKCNTCNLEINLYDTQCGYYTENKKEYCEKCYANKRFNEIQDKSKWLEQVKLIIQEFDEPNFDAIPDKAVRIQKKILLQTMLRKIPDKWETLFKDQNYVKKVKNSWHNKSSESQQRNLLASERLKEILKKR